MRTEKRGTARAQDSGQVRGKNGAEGNGIAARGGPEAPVRTRRHSQEARSPRWRGLIVLPLFGCLVLALGGCSFSSLLRDTNVEIRDAINSFDQAIATLAQQSADWQVVVQDLQESITEDVQSTIRVELTNLSRTVVLGAGAEFRCDADFMAVKLVNELRDIRNDLAQTLNDAGANPPIPLLPVDPPRPVVCSAVPRAVDMSLEEKRRTVLDVYGFDLLSLPITAQVLDRFGGLSNVTSSLGIISDYQMVLDLTEGGAALEEDDRQVVFSWNGDVQSVVPILNPAGGGGLECSTRGRLVTPGSHTFTPPHTQGDQDFKGHGPCVHLTVSPRTDMLGRNLIADVSMSAFECDDDFSKPRSDHTTAAGTTSITLLSLPEGERIVGFSPSGGVVRQYIDDDHQDDLFTFGGNAIVEQARFVGDTDGNEAGTRTEVELDFRNLDVEVETCEGG